MVFSSLVFMFAFLPVVLLIYYLLPVKFRNAFLLIADLIFYGWGEPVLVFLMLFSILINYIAGILIEKSNSNNKKRKFILIASVVIDLGLLGFFKYAGFITNNLKVVLPFLNIPLISIPLPIGISFYTFQIMSYTIDVYRRDTEAQRNIIAFGTYVSLFPQLIAGPIVRYRDVDDQLVERHENLQLFSRGIRLFLLGLAKKVLIANPVGLIWDNMRQMQGGGALVSWVGIIAYTFQIYFDFSGYSDMARGLGNMFGFEFLKNFDYPYISKSITEFWRRWHISLSTWFKEYVYIPLGGNRKGLPRQIFNLFVVWGLTGLWHGASWNFLFWGLYFGVILVFEKLFMLKALDKMPAVIKHLYSLVFIVFGWVIFYYSDDVGGIKAMFTFISTLFTGSFISSDGITAVLSSLPMLIIAAAASTPIIRKIYNKLSDLKGFKYVEAVVALLVLILCTASLVNDNYNPFLYFKF
ncbi:MAG: MBOAT family protein [Clostridia bacterium]|nr:MBOAT family protein [Clostridia bacterium]